VAPAVAESDPLTSNGLASPICSGLLTAGPLPAADRSHCETSGFVAAASPTGGYGIDVHIDTGFLGLSSGGLLSTVQDLFVTPVWTGVVWSVRAVVSMLEWSLAVDLLSGSALRGVGRTLRGMQASLTSPLLGGALAVAAVLTAWSGLVRRRLEQSAADLAAMALMMLIGLWVITDPAGTVGAVASTVDRVSLSVFALPSGAAPGDADAAFASSLSEAFSQAVEGPWCYLEFGAVEWCRDPLRMDPRLRRTALAIAAHEDAAARCSGADCEPSRDAIARSARLLREARTNGALFLALPANGPDRNSINSSGSLLHTLCGSYQATSCRGPTAAQAEFRTDAGTWPRVAGLLLIVAGVIGMLLLIGSIVVRLLTAALLCLVLLMLAPVAVLCPAFGDRGRALFTRWGLQLLAAVVCKVICALALGVLFAASSLLQQLSSAGWWTQWLMTAAFWWGAFLRRHALRGPAAAPVRRPGGHRRLTPVRAAVVAPLAAVRRRHSWPPPAVQPRPGLEHVSGVGSASATREDPSAAVLLESDLRAARSTLEDRSTALRMRARGEQLERVTAALEQARSTGQAKRASRLELRRQRIAQSVAREREARERARATLIASDRATAPGGEAWRAELLEARSRFLDEQASLAPASRSGLGRARDYSSLSPLAGDAGLDYASLSAARQRSVRLAVDRELEGRAVAPPRAPDEVGGENRDDAGAAPRRVVPSALESPVMRDAFEVAAGRKSRLGYDNP
jgi:hypothetical protein